MKDVTERVHTKRKERRKRDAREMMFQFTFHDRTEVWCAIMPNVDDRTIVLENFRVVSVDDGTLSIPDPPPTLSTLRLEKGTPVTIVSKQSHGTVVMLGAHNTLLQMEGVEGTCELAANTDLTYRMGTTIDKTLPPYRVVDGYLVPVEETEVAETEVAETEVAETEVVETEVAETVPVVTDISLPVTRVSYAAWKGKYLSDLVSFAPEELLRTPNVKGCFMNVIVDDDVVYVGDGRQYPLSRVVDTTNVFSNLTAPLKLRLVNVGVEIPLVAHDGTRTTVTAGVGTHFIIANEQRVTVLAIRDMDDWSRETLGDMLKKYAVRMTKTINNVSIPITYQSYAAWKDMHLKQLVYYQDHSDFLLHPQHESKFYNTMDFMFHDNFIFYGCVDEDSIARVVDTNNVFSNLDDPPQIRQLFSGISIPYFGPNGKLCTVTTGQGTHFVVGNYSPTVLEVCDMNNWAHAYMRDKISEYLNDHEDDVEEDLASGEERIPEVIDRPPPRLHNVYDAVRVKPPTGGKRPFQGCTHPGCSKGLHHSGICDVMTWETRKRTATEHYTPAARTNVVSIDDSDDSDDSDDDLPLSKWVLPARPVIKKRRHTNKTIRIHEDHFPTGFRSAVKDKVDALTRGTTDANGQKSYTGVTLQSNGGYYTQTKIRNGHAGRNRYLGVFQRSTVGAFAIVMARLFPDKFDTDSPTVTMRHWMEMMVSDEDVADEWIARVKGGGGRTTKRIRIEELSDDDE